jgi:hypothetical protein
MPRAHLKFGTHAYLLPRQFGCVSTGFWLRQSWLVLWQRVDYTVNCGVGKVQKVRDSLCKVEFNPSVFSRPPFRSQNYILSLDEVEVCPAPLELAKAGQWDEAWKFDLRQMAARFLTMNKGGQLSNARTEILPHQIFTAFTVVSSARRRFMLADEVGLGNRRANYQ